MFSILPYRRAVSDGEAALIMIRLSSPATNACRAAVFGAFVLSATVPVAAAAQSADTSQLMNRIERLERDIRTLNVQIARGGGGGSAVQVGTPADATAVSGDPAYARLSVRLSDLEAQFRNMNGRIEELNFNITQMTQRLEKMSNDVNYRLGQLEQGGAAHGAMPGAMSGTQSSEGAAPMPSSSPSTSMNAPATPPAGGMGNMPDGSRVLGQLSANDAVPTAPAASAPASPAKPSEADALLAQLTGEPQAEPAPSAAPAPSSAIAAPQPQQTASLPAGASPREQYAHAFGLLRQGQYDQASVALKQFLTEHKDDPLAANARYWLGETYYVRGSYVEAAETFLEGYQTDPKGAKAPDALLKLGMSLASLDKKSEACAAFQKLRGDYPNAPAGLKATLQREWQKNGCV